MEVSVKAKERFCKDCNIPLRLFQEPYFADRLELYDRFYGTLSKWELFEKELEKYHCEQDYYIIEDSLDAIRSALTELGDNIETGEYSNKEICDRLTEIIGEI